jgi:4-hydroxy-3-polyprenylbenzoate decarboxylase
MKLIVAITGASGMVYPSRLLKFLKSKKIETYLIVSEPAKKIIEYELEISPIDLIKIASKNYEIDDLSSPISSGSQTFDAMIIIPCSMNTAAAIANGYSDNLIRRVADVALKESRKLIIVPRETPMNAIHLENLLKLAKLNVSIVPACPAFYHKPKNVEQIVDFIVGRVLMQLNIKNDLYKPWTGDLP